MNEKLKNENTANLFKAVMNIDSIEDCYDFFDDLCTVSEIKAMAQRFEVAIMLKDKCVYADIVAKTGASTATISRVNRCLLYGSDGYKKALDKLDNSKKG